MSVVINALEDGHKQHTDFLNKIISKRSGTCWLTYVQRTPAITRILFSMSFQNMHVLKNLVSYIHDFEIAVT